MRSSVLALIALAVVAVLASSAFAQTAPLAGSEWRPIEIDGVEIAEDSDVFVRFADGGRVEGSGGCNRFFGSYEIDGDGIAFGPLAATQMLCPDPAMANETLLFDALARAKRFRRDQADLMLSDDADDPLVRLVQTDWD